ncbi:MAG: ECF-type sigma factor [Gammaproteobacteria bacterium]|jgi:RNA polymerase sigma factor (TIGR02999 family)
MAAFPVPACDVHRILEAVRSGESAAEDRLLTLVYAELRKLTAQTIKNRHAGFALQPRDLVGEACVRVAEDDEPEYHAQLFRAAAKALRRLLVDHAKTRAAMSRNASCERLTLTGHTAEGNRYEIDVLDLDQALRDLRPGHTELAELAELRYFGGLSTEASARLLDIGSLTIERDWLSTRDWLFSRLN